tara:strand:- start:3122 stop:3523 length:402 start_codon:yes stop_codon:yes gene_type:complete
MKKMSYFFVFGFVATIIFHQSALALLFLLGKFPSLPWNMSGVAPLGVPQVISLSFFGGLWGIPLGLLSEKLSGSKYWLMSLGFGAVFPTAVAMLVVFPMKGIPVGIEKVIGGLYVNAVWGLGFAIQHKLFCKK